MILEKLFIYAVSAVCLSVVSMEACPVENIQTSVKVEAAQKKYWISSTGKTAGITTTAKSVVEQARTAIYTKA